MADVSTVLVKDSVIGDITPDLTFAVKSGASSKTFQNFVATSTSNSNLVWNITVPSENTVIDREVLVQTGLSFTVRVDGCPALETAFDYGLLDSLQAFPLASIMTTLNAQINNTSVSINLQDVLPQLVAMTSKRELQHWNGMTPCLRDQTYANYFDGVATNANPLASIDNAGYDEQLLPRGAHPVSCVIAQFEADGTYVSASPVCTTTGNYFLIAVQTIVCEPLFLSPFIYAHPEFNAQGLLGVNNMVIQCNINSTLNRLFSASPFSAEGSALTYAVTSGIDNAFLGHGATPQPNLFQVSNANLLALTSGASSPQLLLQFLSTQASDVIETRNSLPYMDFPRYISPTSGTSPLGRLVSGTFSASSIQLNQIPDLFIICLRKPIASMTAKDSNSFLKINSISINISNTSGLLSSASPYDLWRMSVKNGSTQSWSEFSGQASYKDSATGAGKLVSTVGSLLVINPAYDLSLPDYLTDGSIGQFNFQFSVNVTNTVALEGETFSPEICTITANSGVFVSQQGQSQIFTGLATKEMVLAAKKEKDAVSSVQYARMIGGKMLNAIGLRQRLHRRGGVGERIVGGMMSGAAMSGGKMKSGKLTALC
jgi:hypothetical protein